MEISETLNYLAAVAASDGPIDGKERDLMKYLLQDFGADSRQAKDLVKSLSQPFTGTATLDTLQSRDVALKLLRALLVISYCDGSFDQEELPFLAPIVERFSVTGPELSRAKLQALYYLKLDAPSVVIPPELIQAEQWDAVCQLAHQQYDTFRKDFQRRFEQELKTADEETCYLAMAVGPPSFDTEHTKNRFLQSHPDFFHLEENEALTLLRDEAERKLRNQWDAAYTSRCNACYLEAPGKRRDLCPRCKAEYGEATRR